MELTIQQSIELDKIAEKWTQDAMDGGRRSDTKFAIKKAIEEAIENRVLNP